MSLWACVASGPSLTRADCDLVSDLKTVAVNNAYQYTNGVIFAGDEAWWQLNHQKIRPGRECWTRAQNAVRRFQIGYFGGSLPVFNSGQVAIELALSLGATRILLLGYDCSLQNGTHFHGNHKGLRDPTQKSVRDWIKQFQHVADSTSVPIINCSPSSALTCFPKETLENALSLWHPDRQPK